MISNPSHWPWSAAYLTIRWVVCNSVLTSNLLDLDFTALPSSPSVQDRCKHLAWEATQRLWPSAVASRANQRDILCLWLGSSQKLSMLSWSSWAATPCFDWLERERRRVVAPAYFDSSYSLTIASRYNSWWHALIGIALTLCWRNQVVAILSRCLI